MPRYSNEFPGDGKQRRFGNNLQFLALSLATVKTIIILIFQ